MNKESNITKMGKARNQKYATKLTDTISMNIPPLHHMPSSDLQSAKLVGRTDDAVSRGLNYKHAGGEFWEKPLSSSSPLQPMTHQYNNISNYHRRPKHEGILRSRNQDSLSARSPEVGGVPPGGYVSPLQAQKEHEAKYTIFVGNITADTTQEDVANMFLQFGQGSFIFTCTLDF